jgi:hypothetical protein
MKKLFLVLCVTFTGTGIFAQSDKYIKAMENLVPSVDTTRSVDGLTTLANSFERIANAEKNQWLPFYYAALCYINLANINYQLQQPEKIDPLMEKADPLVAKADELEQNNSEIFLLKKMANSAKMMADPMNRFMTFGMEAAQALITAKKLDPGNPRVYIQEGIDKYYTPEQFGGSKTEGKKLFAEAAEKMKTFTPASSIHPSWGAAQLSYFMTLE